MVKSEKGLTLVEVLATIVVLSMILLLSTSVQMFAHNQANSQKVKNQIQANERLALNRITREIRKAGTVEEKSSNVLVINGTDEYKLVDTTLMMKDEEEITEISRFSVKVTGSKVDLTVGDIPKTTIYIRK